MLHESDKDFLWSEGRRKPTAGIIWNKLSDGMVNDIPPLRELKLIDS
jgi:hypothetical protein